MGLIHTRDQREKYFVISETCEAISNVLTTDPNAALLSVEEIGNLILDLADKYRIEAGRIHKLLKAEGEDFLENC